jgi:membrane-associated HD superfamily phosphohydrolase
MKKLFDTGTATPLDFIRRRLRLIGFPHLQPAPGIVCLCSLIAAVFVTVTNMEMGGEGLGDLGDFEVGKVADRDVVAEYPLSYIDIEATSLRMEAQEYLVPAVFRYSDSIAKGVLESWSAFCDFTDQVAEEKVSPTSERLAVQAEYPAFFSTETLAVYFNSPDRANFRK